MRAHTKHKKRFRKIEAIDYMTLMDYVFEIHLLML